jgi:hypothetical protein
MLLTIALTAATGCASELFAPPPEGATKIPLDTYGQSRFFLLEKEVIPTGRLNAIVLQQFPDRGPGVLFAYQVDCARGPAWTNNTEAGDLAALRDLPVGDEFLRTWPDSEPSQQIAAWVCR